MYLNGIFKEILAPAIGLTVTLDVFKSCLSLIPINFAVWLTVTLDVFK